VGAAGARARVRRAVELILDDSALAERTLTLLEDPAGQKDIAELLRQNR
jgi:hypothetical protein